MSTPQTPGTPHPPDPIRDARERALAEFLAPGPLPESARLAEAEAHLLAELERELGVTIESPTRVPVRAAADRSPGGFGRLLAFFVSPPMRPALAIAAAVVVIAGAWMQFGPAREANAPLLRGPAGTDPIAGWDAHAGVAAMSRGRSRLTWNAAPGATRYAVVFLAGDLSEVARVDNLTTTELMLTPDAPPPGLAGFTSGADLLWRVTAYSGPDEIARSNASPVTLP